MDLKVARAINDLTQEELSKKAGVCRSIISRIEQGKGDKIKSGTKIKIAEALNFSFEELFGKDKQ